MAAQVIARDPSPWFKTIMIDKGSNAGLNKGNPVLVSEGIVGKIVKVSTKSSRVLLIIDRNSSVDALVQNSRVRGIFYDTSRIIYDSALRAKLCGDDQFLEQEVIPILVAFKACLVIRDIKLKKKLEGVKEEEKKDRRSKSPVRRRILYE